MEACVKHIYRDTITDSVKETVIEIYLPEPARIFYVDKMYTYCVLHAIFNTGTKRANYLSSYRQQFLIRESSPPRLRET